MILPISTFQAGITGVSHHVWPHVSLSVVIYAHEYLPIHCILHSNLWLPAISSHFARYFSRANEDICTTSLPNQKPWLYTLLCIPSSSQKIHPATFLERKMSETLLNGTYKGHNSFLCSPNICSTVWMFITHQNSFVEILITKVTVLEGGIFWKMFQRTKLT
jgi:hypothetical protein